MSIRRPSSKELYVVLKVYGSDSAQCECLSMLSLGVSLAGQVTENHTTIAMDEC